jgi:hypothetical protein
VNPKPWDLWPITWWLNDYPEAVTKNRRANGLCIPAGSSEDIMKFNREESGPSHARQYKKLLDSVQSSGFTWEINNLPDVEIFKHQENWFWVNGWDGNHRIALAAALGFTHGLFWVTNAVDDPVESWTHVQDGLYSVDDAEALVSDMIRGCRPMDLDVPSVF